MATPGRQPGSLARKRVTLTTAAATRRPLVVRYGFSAKNCSAKKVARQFARCLVLTVIMSSCAPICTVLSVCAIRSSKKRRERKQNRDETEDVTALLQNYTAQQRRLQLLITPTDDRESDLKLPEIVPTAFLRYDSQS